jgi:hypothetical protein
MRRAVKPAQCQGHGKSDAKSAAPSNVLNVLVPQIAAGVAEHVGMSLDSQLCENAARSTMREKSGAIRGAPRSETNNMNGDLTFHTDDGVPPADCLRPSALLFNPIFPIFLSRATRFYLNVGVALIFAAYLGFVRLQWLQTKAS